MREFALSQITVNDGTDRKIFHRLSPDDPINPNAYSWFGGELVTNTLLDQLENPISGIARLLREQTSLRLRPGNEQLIFGVYSRHIVPIEYSPVDERVKVHLFNSHIRNDVDYEPAFEGLDHLIETKEKLLKAYDVVPMVRFIMEQMSVERHSRLMNGENI
jgi:hypothetical protein